ncbi:Protein NRT1/ PTR FAMILY 8.1, partial [Mucuna pruriens]
MGVDSKGRTLLTFSASAFRLRPSIDPSCCHPTSIQTAACFIGFYFIALRTGGIKSWASSFGADQFYENYDTERKEKSSFFNWFYFSFSMGDGDLEYLL